MKFKVPVKHHVRDFYVRNPQIFGDKGDVRKNSMLGLWVMTVFAHPPAKNSLDYEFLEVSPLEDDEYIQTELVINLTFDIPTKFITDERLMHLGNILETNMEFFAVGWIRGRLNVLASENAAASEFMKEHQINDGHITADKFRMMHRRMAEKGRKSKMVKKS